MRNLLLLSVTVGLACLHVDPCIAQPSDVNIQCEANGLYVGNVINPVFRLVIGGPMSKNWQYELTDDYSGTRPTPLAVQAKGTYTIADDLAIFTGVLTSNEERAKPEPLRFGLNFGKVNGEIQFDRFFPAGGDRLRCHRAWFVKKNDTWVLLEDLDLTIPSNLPEKQWKVHFTGTRRFLDDEGMAQREQIDQMLTFRDYGRQYFGVQTRGPKWAPTDLLVESDGRRITSVCPNSPTIGELRGFYPGLAKRRD